MNTGLVLGKFAPLHKGHQLLIETAIAENDQVVILIYHSPEVTNVPLGVRAGWIKTLYPTVRVIEAWDGPTEMGDSPEIKRRHDQYILQALNGMPIANFYSSEFYGEHVSVALRAHDRRIDSDRCRFPVSATAIRADPFSYREFLDPIVYLDLILKVVVLGAPSTGKTTLARELAAAHQTVWMPEYGREYWEAHQLERRLTVGQLLEIAIGHREREDTLALNANRILFVDTDATTTWLFSQYYHGAAHPQLVELTADAQRRYDLALLCDVDIPYDDTWDRSGAVQRDVFQAQIIAQLAEQKRPYVTLSGSLPERLATATDLLKGFDKYSSLADHLLRNAKQNRRL
jgi:NadR type nicotinamide-nucleotide adenylyltransferase